MALGVLPVPATALVLFVITAAVVPQLRPATDAVLDVLPVYIAFAIGAPFLGWLVARQFQLPPAAGRSLAFSAGTRNSLVVLPLALAIPGAVPILPAVIVAQTLVETAGRARLCTPGKPKTSKSLEVPAVYRLSSCRND